MRTTFREIRNSRQISLIDFPWTSESRRIFAIVSTTNIQIARDDAYLRARLADVPLRYAKLLLNPEYPPERPRYRRKKPRRPVLAKRRTAFVFDTH